MWSLWQGRHVMSAQSFFMLPSGHHRALRDDGRKKASALKHTQNWRGYHCYHNPPNGAVRGQPRSKWEKLTPFLHRRNMEEFAVISINFSNLLNSICLFSALNGPYVGLTGSPNHTWFDSHTPVIWENMAFANFCNSSKCWSISLYRRRKIMFNYESQ